MCDQRKVTHEILAKVATAGVTPAIGACSTWRYASVLVERRPLVGQRLR